MKSPMGPGNWAWADDTDDDEDEKITAEANQISAIIEATSDDDFDATPKEGMTVSCHTFEAN